MYRYTKEEKNWLNANIPGKTSKETVKAFRKKFGKEISPSQVSSYRKNNKIPCGVSGAFQKGHITHNKGKKVTDEERAKWGEKYKANLFKKGNIPFNKQEVGCVIRKNGNEFIKVANPSKWMLRSRYVWQQHYNEILSSKDLIIHLDGDGFNNSIENLEKVTKQELLQINKSNAIKSNPELTKVAIAEVRLRMLIHEKGAKKCKECIYYEAKEGKGFYCNNPRYTREKNFSVAVKCLGYRKEK